MSKEAQTIGEIRDMADEVARLMAERFGGARRGEQPSLEDIIRRRGGALPGRLRKAARRLAMADRMAAQPRLGRQIDRAAASRAYRQLVAYLRPMGQLGRWRSGVVGVLASVLFGILIAAAVLVWLMVQRGHL